MTAGDAAPVASGLWPGHRALVPHGREGLREAPPGKCGLRGGAPGTPAPVWPIAEAAAGPGLPVTEVRAPGRSTRPAQWPRRPRGPPVAPSATGRPPGNPTGSSASSPTVLCPTRLCPTPRFSKGRGPRAGDASFSFAPFPPAARWGWTVNRTRHLGRSPQSLSPQGSPITCLNWHRPSNAFLRDSFLTLSRRSAAERGRGGGSAAGND